MGPLFAGARFSRALLADVSAGSLCAFVSVTYAVSYAALIFSGPDLGPYLALGVQSALLASALLALVVAIGSSYAIAIAGVDSNPVAVLAVMIPGLAAALVADRATPDELVATVAMGLAASTSALGLLVLFLGVLRQGRLARYIPFAVSGGFLAGTGFRIGMGAFGLVTGHTLSWVTVTSIEQAPPLALGVAILVAAGLILAPRFWRSVLLTPTLVVAGSLVFYAALAFSGLNLEQARAEGMLMTPLASASSPPAAIVKGLPLVRWDVLAGEWHHLAIIAVVVLIAVPLNTASVEVETGQDADFDREFRVSGIANVVAGIVGGMPGYVSVSRTSLNFKAGATSRASGIWCGLLILAVTFAFTPALTYIPKPVLAGLLVALSYGMVREWLWNSFVRLPLSEYVLILAITALIVGPGLVPGFGFGILASTVLFVYRYGRARHVRHSFSASQHSSNKERPVPHVASLHRRGEAARVLSLQGYLFFGSAIGIVDSCRQLIEREGVEYLLLDFRLVEGIDISASSAFTKLYQLCQRRSGQLLLTGLGEPVRQLLDRTGLLAQPGLHVLPDLDRGLEWIEDQLLAGDPLPAEAGGCDSDLHVLLQQNLTAEALDVVLNMCNTISFSPGEALFRRNDPGDSLYLIERGQVSVMLPFEDGQAARLGSSGAGTVVGEMALYTQQPRSADAIADTTCQARQLTLDALATMQRDYPDAALQFHRLIVRILAGRLAAANSRLKALS